MQGLDWAESYIIAVDNSGGNPKVVDRYVMYVPAYSPTQTLYSPLITDRGIQRILLFSAFLFTYAWDTISTEREMEVG